jgi:dipeptidyl aminopeptidase/acylaminoacyl peptidase
MLPEDVLRAELPPGATYRRHGWPACTQPDRNLANGWEPAMTATHGILHHHAPSPSGDTLAVLWNINDQTDVYLMGRDTWARRLTFDRPVSAPWSDSPAVWSPDGARIAYCQQGGIWLADPIHGTHRRLTDPALDAASPRWLDSQRLVCALDREERDQLFLIELEHAWPQALVTNLPGDILGIRPAPDGKRVAFVLHLRDDLHTTALYLVDVTTGACHCLRQDNGFWIGSPRWLPGSDWICYRSQRTGWWQVYAVRPDGSGDHAITIGAQDVEEYALSPNGNTLLAAVRCGGEIALDAWSFGENATPQGSSRRIAAPRGSIHNLHFISAEMVTCEVESPVLFPEIHQVNISNAEWKRVTCSEPLRFAALGAVVPDAVGYRSRDGIEIPAFLYRPAKPNGAAVVHPHGGPTSQHTLDWDPFIQYFVALGYTWLAPNFRGSTGYGLDFQKANEGNWGVGDTDDCLAGADFLSAQPGIDGARIAIYGASYGSYMAVTALVRDPKRFACGIAKFGDCDILSSWAETDRVGRLDLEKQMEHPSRARPAYRAGSPVWEVDRMQKPLLLAHGLRDKRVPPRQSEELAEAMTRAGKTFEYITYANEGHGFFHTANAAHFTKSVQRFLEWYLL